MDGAVAPPLFCQRAYDSYRAVRRCGELIDFALHGITPSVGPHRSHPIVISRLRLQADQPHPEDGFGVIAIQPDERFRRLVQITRISAVVGDGVMLIVAARIGAGPLENRHIGTR
jgi:hypothetical protein